MSLVKDGIIIGTWNVRTLKQSDKIELLVNEMDRVNWNILGISEMRWKGIGQIVTEDGHGVWFSGNPDKHQFGTGFLVQKWMTKYILEYTPVSERIISLRVACKPSNLTVVQVYAPTSDCSGQEIEEFCENLETLLKYVPRKDTLVVQDDWNAKIGMDACKQWKGYAGRFGVGTTNERFSSQKHTNWLLQTLFSTTRIQERQRGMPLMD